MCLKMSPPPTATPLFKDGAPLNYCTSETVCAWIMDDCGAGRGGGGAERSGAETSLEVGHSCTQGDERSKKERKERGGCCVINITKNMQSEGGRERGDTEGDLCSGRRGARQVGGERVATK